MIYDEGTWSNYYIWKKSEIVVIRYHLSVILNDNGYDTQYKIL